MASYWSNNRKRRREDKKEERLTLLNDTDHEDERPSTSTTAAVSCNNDTDLDSDASSDDPQELVLKQLQEFAMKPGITQARVTDMLQLFGPLVSVEIPPR